MDENEELYDSLDEDFHSISNNSFEVEISKLRLDEEQPPLKESPSTTDIYSLIPLYEGETSKNGFKVPIKSRNIYTIAKSPIPNKSRIAPSSIAKPKYNKQRGSCSSIDNIKYYNGENSYLGLHQTRFELSTKKINEGPGDTVRSIYNTTRSSITSESDFDDAQDFIDDTDSFYINLINENDKRAKTEFYNSKVSLLSSATTAFQFKCASQDSLSCFSKGSNITILSQSKPSLKVPVLGGLGPDTEAIKEKLARLKKKQAYGKKVSYTNRIKMVETKVLQNLKNEIKQSNLDQKAIN